MGHLKTNRNLEYNNYWQRQLRNTLKILIEINENVQMTDTQRKEGNSLNLTIAFLLITFLKEKISYFLKKYINKDPWVFQWINMN